MSNKVIRFGILSCAHYHAHFWAQSINEIAEAVLVGVWDDDTARGEEAAQRHKTRYWPDLQSLLHECDAVGITAETVKHAPLIEEAAALGLHILCEKPMAATLEDCDRIAQAVHKAGVVYMQNFPKRFDPITQEFVNIVKSGTLGHITLVRIRHGHYYGVDKAFRKQWYVDPALAGGGALLDEGIHDADFLLWLLGEPDSVYATLSHQALDLPVEDTALAIYTFPSRSEAQGSPYHSGTIAEVANSWAFLAGESVDEVFGTEGTLLLSGVDLASREFVRAPYLKMFRQGQPRGVWESSQTIPLSISKDRRNHYLGPQHFIECLRTGKKPMLGLEEGRKSLLMIRAAYQSAEKRAPQQIVFTR